MWSKENLLTLSIVIAPYKWNKGIIQFNQQLRNHTLRKSEPSEEKERTVYEENEQKLNCQSFVSHVFFAGFRIKVTVLHYPPLNLQNQNQENFNVKNSVTIC